jgi:hypothetical protein
VEAYRQFLYKLASSFRYRLEMYTRNLPTYKPYDVHITREFPNGCCYDTCLLLGRFLRENGVRKISCVVTNSHAWLLVQGFIVDITGDQELFSEVGLKSVEVVIAQDPRYKDLQQMYEVISYDYRELYRSQPLIIMQFNKVYREISMSAAMKLNIK